MMKNSIKFTRQHGKSVGQKVNCMKEVNHKKKSGHGWQKTITKMMDLYQSKKGLKLIRVNLQQQTKKTVAE